MLEGRTVAVAGQKGPSCNGVVSWYSRAALNKKEEDEIYACIVLC